VSNTTKNQHYVWQHYLRAWAVNGQIYCLRQRDKKVFPTNPKNVGSERYFYRTHELSELDARYIDNLIERSDEKLREINRGFVKMFQAAFVYRKLIANAAQAAPERAEAQRHLDEMEKTLGERYHFGIEDRAKPFLDALRRREAEFYTDSRKASQFLYFLANQYFRTAKMRNAIGTLPQLLGRNFERTWPIESHIYASNVGLSLYAQRSDYRINFLENATAIPFIAGDQPVINLNDASNAELRLYYPVSPSTAVLLSSDPKDTLNPRREVSVLEVETLNFRLFGKPDDQVYCNHPEYLEALKVLDKSAADECK
jgi:hypothetical protein